MKKKICEICFVKWGQNGGKKSPFGGKNSQKEHYATSKKIIIKAKNYLA